MSGKHENKLLYYIGNLAEFISKLNIRFHNLFIFTFILWYATEIVFNTTLKTIFGISIESLNSFVNLLIFALLMIQIMLLLPSYGKKELLIIAVITMPVALAAFLSDHRSMLSAWMFVVASKNENMDRVIKTAFKILVITVPLVCISCLLGWIEDEEVFMRGIERSSLGFSHPNQLGLRIFQLLVCHCYINKEKKYTLDYIFIIAAIVFVYTVPNSQTACMCLGIFLLLLCIYKGIENRKQIILKIYMWILWAAALSMNVFSIILSYINVDEYPVLARINLWMSARFTSGHRVWEMYGVSFFGQRVYVTPEERALVGVTERLWLDNAYASILLRYGILVFVLFSIAYLWLMRYTASREMYILTIILFMYALYGVMENGLFTLAHNIFLIAFGDLLYKKGEKPLCGSRGLEGEHKRKIFKGYA